MRLSISVLMAGAMLTALAFGANAAPQGSDDTGWYGPGWMMGPGMMGGYGQYGMGPRVECRTYGPEMGQGYGPMGRMMGGFGDYGMGRHMMRGFDMGQHGGMFGHMGRGMMMGFGMFRALNLTDDQRDKITHIMDAQRKEMWKQMGAMMDAREKMRDLYDVDQPDPRKVGAAYAEISGIRQKMLEARVRSHNEIWNLLTKEQRDQLQDWRHGRWGQGPHGKGGKGMMGQ